MLPKKKTAPVKDFNKFNCIVYGAPKIGKSTFCSNIPNTLFLDTEYGLKTLDTFEVKINNINDLTNAYDDIKKGDHSFQNIVIDTVDSLYQLCRESVMEKYKIEHESDLSMGKGWEFVKQKFFNLINAFLRLPYRIIFVSHEITKEVETRIGKKEISSLALPDKVSHRLMGMVDIILYAALKKDKNGLEKRILCTKSTINYHAGDRSNLLPEFIDMDFSKLNEIFNKERQKKL